MMESDRVDWRIRAGFFAVAAESVRRILVDQARQRAQSPAILVAALPGRNIDILQLDDAIERLAAFDSKKAQVVELRYFGGLSAEECEELTGLSTPAVKREWAVAKAWLYRELRDEGDLGARTVA
jgi:RNA polymerase sigma factor (TIGR02999 family)